MKRYFQSSVSALAMSALVMSSAVVATVGITAAPAFSQSSNANGNPSNGNRSERRNQNSRSNNGRGSTASSLGALNAAHANAMALDSAARNSRVGLIDIYRTAFMASAEQDGTLAAAEAELIAFVTSCGDDQDSEYFDADLEDEKMLTPEQCVTLLENTSFGEQVTEFERIIGVERIAAENLARIANDALMLAANKDTDEDAVGAVIAALWDLLPAPTE